MSQGISQIPHLLASQAVSACGKEPGQRSGIPVGTNRTKPAIQSTLAAKAWAKGSLSWQPPGPRRFSSWAWLDETPSWQQLHCQKNVRGSWKLATRTHDSQTVDRSLLGTDPAIAAPCTCKRYSGTCKSQFVHKHVTCQHCHHYAVAHGSTNFGSHLADFLLLPDCHFASSCGRTVVC